MKEELKKPLTIVRKAKEKMGICPACGMLVYGFERTCPCGQKLDWCDDEQPQGND